MLLDLQMPQKNGIQVVQEVKDFYKQLQEEFTLLRIVEPEFVFLTAFSSMTLRKHLK